MISKTPAMATDTSQDILTKFGCPERSIPFPLFHPVPSNLSRYPWKMKANRVCRYKNIN
jgi:hypothetical protein